MQLATYREYTYSHQLAKSLVLDHSGQLNGCELTTMSSAAEIVNAIRAGQGDFGLVPFKNRWALTRGVPLSYRLLMPDDVHLHRVISHLVKVYAAGPEDVPLAAIDTVHVMSVQVPQCSEFLATLGADTLVDTAAIDDTSEAMRRASEGGRGAIGLGTIEAVVRYDLNILASEIQNPENFTTFLLLSNRPPPSGGTRLVGFEIDSSVTPEDKAAAVAQEVFETSEWQAVEFWIEDKSRSGEPNHMVIAEARNPKNKALAIHHPVLALRDLGQSTS